MSALCIAIPFKCWDRGDFVFRVELTSKMEAKNFPVLFLTSGKERGNRVVSASPFSSEAPKGERGRGTRPPISPVGTGEDRGTPSPSSGLHRPSVADLDEERQALKRALSEVAQKLSALNGELAPVDAEARDIAESIQSTHTGGKTNGINLDPRRITARRSMFDRLTQLSVKYGAKRNKRRELFQRQKSFEREIERLARHIQAQKKGKA